MSTRKFFGTLAVLCIFYSGAAFAIYNGVSITGVDPDSIQTVTISLPGEPATSLTRSKDCEDDPDEDCPKGFAWYYESGSALVPGTTGNISYLDKDGNRHSGSVTVGPDGVLGANFEPAPATALNGFHGAAVPYGGYFRSDVAPIGIGVLVDQMDSSNPTKTPLLMTDDDVSGWNFGGAVLFPAGPKWKVGFEFNYAEADGNGQQSFSAADLGSYESLGWLYDARAENGSTGLTANFMDLDGSYQMDLKYARARLTAEYDLWPSNSGVKLTPFVGLQYGSYKLDTTQSLVMDGSIFGSDTVFRSDRMQTLKDSYWGLGGGIRGSFQPLGNSGLELGFGASIWGDYVRNKLRSTQMNACSICSMYEQQFDVTRDKNDDQFGYEAEFRLNGGVSVTPGVSVGVFGRAKYMSDMSAVMNPLAESDLDSSGSGSGSGSGTSNNDLGGPALNSAGGWSMQAGAYAYIEF